MFGSLGPLEVLILLVMLLVLIAVIVVSGTCIRLLVRRLTRERA
jgi:hypothetical protein